MFLGNVLGGFSKVHAMIDVSDGLYQDLSHILQASKVGAKIEYDKVPREKDFEATCRSLRINAADTLISGGEDYQLLFTMDDSNLEALQKKNAGAKKYSCHTHWRDHRVRETKTPVKVFAASGA